MLRIFLIVLFSFVLQNVSAEILIHTANPGEYLANAIGETSNVSHISTSIKITDFDSSPEWPPAAYVGFYEGPNRNESFQFLIIRNGGNSPFLTAGYRVIEGGKEKSVESLANLPLGASASVDLSFNKGVVTLKFENQSPITLKTKLSKVTPYVSVSSGTVEFDMRP